MEAPRPLLVGRWRQFFWRTPLRTTVLPLRAALLLVLVLIVGCAGPASTPRSGGGGDTTTGQRSGGTKRVTAAILGDLNTFSYLINVGVGSIRGVDEVEKLVHVGM